MNGIIIITAVCFFQVCFFQTAAFAQNTGTNETAQLDKLTRDGRTALSNNDLQSALDNFKAAKELAPESAVVWVNYGFALGRRGEYVEAINSLQKAIKLDSNTPMAWLDLGSLYQSSGQIPLAIETFTEYLKRFPKDDSAADARAILAILKKNQQSFDTQDSTDYFQGQMKAGIQKWDLRRLPLKVFIEEGTAEEDYKPSYMDPVISAFQNWQAKSDQLISFTPVNSPKDADITVRWTKDTKQLVAQGEAGDCSRELGPQGIKRARITLLTCAPPTSAVPFNEKLIHWVCMHEIGHALGLTAHSPNANDIMYSTVTFDMERKDISPRDIATLRRTYDTTIQMTKPPSELYNEAVKEIAVQNQLPPANQNFLPTIEKLEKVQSMIPADTVLGLLGYSYGMYANRLLLASQLNEAAEYYKKALAVLPKGNPAIENMIRKNYASVLRIQHRDAEADAVFH